MKRIPESTRARPMLTPARRSIRDRVVGDHTREDATAAMKRVSRIRCAPALRDERPSTTSHAAAAIAA